MKKIFFSGCLSVLLISVGACYDNAKSNTHTHDDGTTHAAHDTVKPAQEQFNVADTIHKDTTDKSIRTKTAKSIRTNISYIGGCIKAPTYISFNTQRFNHETIDCIMVISNKHRIM
jgi:hypothetical protein